MEHTYVTFGQDHRHEIGGVVFDKDCVARVEGDRAKVFDLFGREFCFAYPEEVFSHDSLRYFPRGVIDVPTEEQADGTGTTK